jgi:hypothetical protein
MTPGHDNQRDDPRIIPFDPAARFARHLRERELALGSDSTTPPEDPTSESHEERPSSRTTSGPTDLQKLRARHRQRSTFEAQRQNKMAKIWLKRCHNLFKMAFAVLAVWGLVQVVQVPYWLFETPRFTLSGNQRLTQAMVAPLVHHETGQRWTNLNPQALASAIQHQYPWVDHVAVRRILWGSEGFGRKTLSIQVVEKPLAAALYSTAPSPRPYAVMGHDKTIISVQKMPASFLADLAHSPELGRFIVPIRVCQQLSRAPEQVERLAQLRQQLAQMPHLRVEQFRLSPNHQVDVDFQVPSQALTTGASVPHPTKAQSSAPPKVTAWLGLLDEGLPMRAERLVDLSDTLQQLGSSIDRIDLRWSKQVTLHRRGVNPVAPTPAAAVAPATTTAKVMPTSTPAKAPTVGLPIASTSTSVR